MLGLAPSDFYVFANLIKMFIENRFGSNDEVLADTGAYVCVYVYFLYVYVKK